ncbi:hypothetical protein DICPUDRAFT_151299 [Dictyostelium purpureum]|uniref:Glutathione S-transferase n=1 Tax=Dictyostelium purpureum TaxID=5786 RepID=F0ZIH9_DICPU|nr:uncharacterized protein DICPUDRAFT_151299 [Dictyostelium purpureum]EGC36282.1 hypothetical protein DICPUDRAFT_151299 [Dictyostelium purpureum]|eukprot:XP_003287228.1 hypothetical protein DICPUDRAFT_151299 [Dictyostelium purpureum]
MSNTSEIKKNYELYGANTSNVYKIHIMFKELGITDYEYHSVDIMKGDQFKPEFLKLNRNNKVPVIVDNTVKGAPFPIFESGAILIYLAEKHGKFLAGTDNPIERSETLQWLAWQISGQGPFSGQLFHFKYIAKEKIPYAIQRYNDEVHRLYTVLDGHLKDREYVVGNSLTIADISIYGWAFYLFFNIIVEDWENKYPNVKRWLELLHTRPVFKEVFEDAEKSFKERAAQLKKE